MSEYKTCKKCLQHLPLSSYKPNAKRPGQFLARCASCIREANNISASKWRANNPDYAKSYLAANRDYKNAYKKDWRLRNPGKQSLYSKTYALTNPDRVRAAQKKYENSRPGWVAYKAQLRRARKKANGVFVIRAKEFMSLYKKPCFYCGSKTEHVDHVIPIARGGRHSIGNLVPACASCNLSKQDKLLMEWIIDTKRAIVMQKKGRK